VVKNIKNATEQMKKNNNFDYHKIYEYMLKQIIKETVKILISRPRIIRLALLTSYSYTFYQIY
jgi:hypothetical protein